MSVSFVYFDPSDSSSSVRTAPLPLIGLSHLASTHGASKGAAILHGWINQKLNCTADILGVYQPETKQMIPTETIIEEPDRFVGQLLYVIPRPADSDDEADAEPESISASPNDSDEEANQQATRTPAGQNTSQPSDPSSSIFSLRLPNESHRQVYLNELTDLIQLRKYTHAVPLELLWSMLPSVLSLSSSNSSSISSSPSLTKEAFVALWHALIQYVAEKEPNAFPADVQKPNTSTSAKAIEIPAAVTASIVRLHNLVTYDAQHLQSRSANNNSAQQLQLQAQLDQQQLIAICIFLAQGMSTWEQLYLAFSLFTDARDSDSSLSDLGDAFGDDPQQATLTRAQFLRFLRATLFPSVITIVKEEGMETVCNWIAHTTEFIVENLSALFDIEDGRISFEHLMRFQQSYPNILAFIHVADRIDARLAGVSASVVDGDASGSRSSQSGPPVSMSVRRGGPPADRTPLSPLHESPEERDSEEERKDAVGELSPPDSPLFTFAGNVRQTSSDSETALPTPANSRAVSGATQNTQMARQTSTESTTDNYQVPSNSRASSAGANLMSRQSSTGSNSNYQVPANSRATSGAALAAAPAQAADARPSVLVNPHTGEELTLDPSNVHMLRGAYHTFDHLSVSALLLILQQYEESAEINMKGFDRAVQDALKSSAAAKSGHELQSRIHLNNIFVNFDVENSNCVDVIELAVGLSILCGGSADDKLRFAFHLFDSNSCGYITVDELSDLFTSLLRPILPNSDVDTHNFLKRFLDAFVPALFQQARAQEIDASDASEQEEEEEEEDSSEGRRTGISFAEFSSMFHTYAPRIDWLGVVQRLLNLRAQIFQARPQQTQAQAQPASAPRKVWDRSSVPPAVARVAQSSDDECDSDGDIVMHSSDSDAASDLDAYIDPAAKAIYQATHHFPTYDEYRDNKNAMSQLAAALEETRSERSRRAVQVAAANAACSSDEDASSLDSPSESEFENSSDGGASAHNVRSTQPNFHVWQRGVDTKRKSHQHKKPKTDDSLTDAAHLEKDPAYQLGLFRHFKIQQDALRALHQNAESHKDKANGASVRFKRQKHVADDAPHTPVSSKPKAGVSSFSSPVIPPLSFAAVSVPAVASQPEQFAKWAQAVTPRKPTGGAHADVESSPLKRHGRTPTHPTSINLLPASGAARDTSDSGLNGLPSSLEFSVTDLERLHRFVNMMRSLQPQQADLKYLSPAAVILKVMEPDIDTSAADGTPLVSADDFYRNLRFVLETTSQVQEVSLDEGLVDYLLACCAISFQSAASLTDSNGAEIDQVDIQDFLLAITAFCDRGWKSSFRLVDDQNVGAINREQLARLFSCCVRLLFGVHEGLKMQLGSSGFSALVDCVVSASVESFFGIADSSSSGLITLKDFSRVRLRYPNLLPWLGMMQQIQKAAAADGEEEEEEDGPNTRDSSPIESAEQSFEIPSDEDEDDDEPYGSSDQEISASPIHSDGSDVEANGDDAAVPTLTFDAIPSAPDRGIPPTDTALVNLFESDLYHFLFLRSLASTLDSVTLIQTVMLIEQQLAAVNGDAGMDGFALDEWNFTMAFIFPISALPRAYHRLLSSILNQMFLLLSKRDSQGQLRVQPRHLVLACHILLPNSHELNSQHAFEYLAAVTNSGPDGNLGCLTREDFEEFCAIQLRQLLAVASSSFRFSPARNSVSLKTGVAELIRRASQRAADVFFRIGRLRSVRSTAAGTRVQVLSYGEYKRVYEANPTALPWAEILEGLLEGEAISKAEQQANLDDSMASAAYEEEQQPQQQQQQTYDDEYIRQQYNRGYVAMSDSDSDGASPFDSSSEPNSPALPSHHPKQAWSITVNDGAGPHQADARKAFFDRWKTAAASPKKETERQPQSQRAQPKAKTNTRPTTAPAERVNKKADNATQKSALHTLFTQRASSAGSSAASSRRSSASSAASSNGSRRGQKKRKSRAGPLTLSVDPFSVTLTTAQNPSPRAVLSAVKTKPLPAFTTSSSAPKLLLCIPMGHSGDDDDSTSGSSFKFTNAQSLKVYSTDLPAFTFFKDRLKTIDINAMRNWIIYCHRACQSQRSGSTQTAGSIFYRSRFNRVEFSDCLRELLYGADVHGRSSVAASTGDLQQLNQYSVALFRAFDHQSRGGVLVMEVILAMSLFLDRTPDEKLQFAFNLLAGDRSNLTVDQLQLFFLASFSTLTALCSTHFRMSVPSQPCSPAAVGPGPLSPSSVHSLPHELLQRRLESEAHFQAGEVLRLATTAAGPGSRIELSDLTDVVSRHRHIFSWLNVIDLDHIFSPKAATGATQVTQQEATREMAQQQNQLEADLAAAANCKETKPFQRAAASGLRLQNNFTPSTSAYAPMGSPTYM